jgi:hypothetical protein
MQKWPTVKKGNRQITLFDTEHERKTFDARGPVVITALGCVQSPVFYDGPLTDSPVSGMYIRDVMCW